MKKDKPPKTTSKGCDCTEKVFDEFLEDVENDMKMERYQQLLKKYKKLISQVTTIVLGLAILVVSWQKYESDKKEEFATALLNAIDMGEKSTTADGFEDALGLMSHIANKNPRTYGVFGKLLYAAQLAKKDAQKNAPEIQRTHMSIMRGRAPGYIKELASALYVQSKLEEQTEVAPELGQELIGLLKKYRVSKSGYALLSKEQESMVLFKLKDFVTARKVLDEISRDEKTPAGMHFRVSLLIQAIQDQETPEAQS
jgi:hypothetical protein